MPASWRAFETVKAAGASSDHRRLLRDPGDRSDSLSRVSGGVSAAVVSGGLTGFIGYVVAYDEELADRIRELLATERDVTEKRMFGGLTFLVGGNMAVSASGKGGIMVRVDPNESDRLVESTPAEFMVMRGRQMDGWLRVQPVDIRTKRELAKWVTLGVTFARSLPPKRTAR